MDIFLLFISVTKPLFKYPNNRKLIRYFLGHMLHFRAQNMLSICYFSNFLYPIFLFCFQFYSLPFFLFEPLFSLIVSLNGASHHKFNSKPNNFVPPNVVDCLARDFLPRDIYVKHLKRNFCRCSIEIFGKFLAKVHSE